MKIGFFGDSWTYHWDTPSYISNSSLQQYKTSREGYSIKDRHEHHEYVTPEGAIFLYGALLSQTGHEAKCYGYPGNCLVETVNDLLTVKEEFDCYVVMVSNMFRTEEDFANLPANVTSDLKSFITYIESEQLRQIWRINRFAEENKKDVFLVGGHCPLSPLIAQQLHRNVHILYEDYLKEVLIEREPEYDGYFAEQSPNYFRLSTEVPFSWKGFESWDQKIIAKIIHDIEQVTPITPGQKTPLLFKLVYPDGGHPNGSTSIALVEKLQYLLENLKK
tara:strand:- start:24937 stop:25764 length:828 start_codon:yes stop_codon:yes gene_type:complete